MPNPVKFDNAFLNTRRHSYINNKNFYIGTSGDFGPTSSTGYWAGITPPVNGYTFYENRASTGPSIRVFSNETDLSTALSKYFGDTFEFTNAGIVSASLANDICILNRDVENIPSTNLLHYWEPNLVMSSVSGSSKVFSLGQIPNITGSMVSASSSGTVEADLWGEGTGNDYIWNFRSYNSEGNAIITNITQNDNFRDFSVVMRIKVASNSKFVQPYVIFDKSYGDLGLHDGISIWIDNYNLAGTDLAYISKVTVDGEDILLPKSVGLGTYFPYDVWRCVSFKFNSKNFNYYLAGTGGTPYTASFSSTGTAGITTPEPLCFGKRPLSDTDFFFSGSIGSIGFYTGSRDLKTLADEFLIGTNQYT